ncbi:MAG: hypothetical protein ABI729_10960 [Chitinophagales bacterium]
MKTIAFLSLLLMVLFYAAGYYLLFTFNELRIKKEMNALIRSGLLADQYTVLTFPASHLESMKVETAEFVYEGNRYDIVKEVTSGDKVIVTCLQDVKEAALISSIRSYLGKDDSAAQNPAAGNNSINLLKFLQTDFITSASQRSPVASTSNINSVYTLFIYQWPITSLNNPPPESICS